MAKPLFILGSQRSGTTWITNQLSAHSDIAGITHDEHFGTHESAYFDYIYGRYGDLSYKANYVEFVEVMAASDFFVLAGADREFLYSLFPTTYEGVLQAVMDRYAEQQGKSIWIEKSPRHTLRGELIADGFPDAKFVGIIRDVESFVGSAFAFRKDNNQSKTKRFAVIVYYALRWTYYNKKLRRFARTHSSRIYMTTYEKMRADINQVMHGICDFVGIPFEEQLTERQFAPNTSFTKDVDSSFKLSDSEKQFVKVVATLAQIIPIFAFGWAEKVLVRFRKERKYLPEWFFRVTRSSDHESRPLGVAPVSVGDKAE
jgi:hypothetical protein